MHKIPFVPERSAVLTDDIPPRFYHSRDYYTLYPHRLSGFIIAHFSVFFKTEGERSEIFGMALNLVAFPKQKAPDLGALGLK
jgi:hypothetical protein